MAKNRSRSSSSNKGRRDVHNSQTLIANRPWLPPRASKKQSDLEVYLSEIEDRRTSHPSGRSRPARSTNRQNHVLVPSQSGKKALADALQFEDPERVLICIRRKQRKEVLHAFNKTGKGGQKRPRRNYFSEIHC